MHYKNGRPATIGDWVFGPTFNLDHCTVGIVVELMEKQGDCNVRLYVFPSFSTLFADDREDRGLRLRVGKDKSDRGLDCKEEWADAKKLVLIQDAFNSLVCASAAHWSRTGHPPVSLNHF